MRSLNSDELLWRNRGVCVGGSNSKAYAEGRREERGSERRHARGNPEDCRLLGRWDRVSRIMGARRVLLVVYLITLWALIKSLSSCNIIRFKV